MKTIVLLASMLFAIHTTAQVVKDYNPSIQKTSHIQYFKPTEEHLFTGDCMPYFHKDTGSNRLKKTYRQSQLLII